MPAKSEAQRKALERRLTMKRGVSLAVAMHNASKTSIKKKLTYKPKKPKAMLKHGRKS